EESTEQTMMLSRHSVKAGVRRGASGSRYEGKWDTSMKYPGALFALGIVAACGGRTVLDDGLPDDGNAGGSGSGGAGGGPSSSRGSGSGGSGGSGSSSGGVMADGGRSGTD